VSYTKKAGEQKLQRAEKMRQVILKEPKNLEVCERSIPGLSEEEALIRVSYCGICGSDIHSYLGKHPFVKYPVTPGHEFTGTVVDRGARVDESILGRAVCVEPSITCGKCPECLSGKYNICRNLKVLGFQADGAMREYLPVPKDKLHVLPNGVDKLSGALAEPAAVAVHAIERGRVNPDSCVLVIGGGVIGLALTQILRSMNCFVAVVEDSSEKAERALVFGANTSFVFDEIGAKRSNEYLEREPDVIFECVGKNETMEFAIKTAPNGKTIIVVGVFPEPATLSISLVQDHELDILGTLMYTADDFKRALELISSGAIEPRRFITHMFRLESVKEAYETAIDPGGNSLKVLLEIGDGH